MSDATELDALSRAEEYLTKAGLINESGAVLYAGASTLRPGPVYLVGLNPGGSEGASLRNSIDASRREHNAYLDEQWAPGGHLQPVGQATLQRRIQHLCTRMGLETRKVPASNLVFTRSSRLNKHLGFEEALKLCRPVHEIFVEAIKPSFLMTFGSIENFKKAVSITSIESRLANHGTWKAHRGTGKLGSHEFAFGNIPHMSLWASDSREEVVDWAIKRPKS
jgi:hypothetical protein